MYSTYIQDYIKVYLEVYSKYIQAPVGKCGVSNAKVYLSTFLRMHVKYTWNAPWTHIFLDVHYRICVYSCAAGSGYSLEARKIYCILKYIKRIFNYILDNVVYSQVHLQYIYAIYCKYTLNISENIKYRYTFYGPQRIYSLNIVKRCWRKEQPDSWHVRVVAHAQASHTSKSHL